MATIAERLKEGMQMKNFRQADIVQRTGINKGALSSYLSGRYEPKQNNIYLLAKALNVNEAWLMGADVPMERQERHPVSTTRIPVLGRVAAGIPFDAIEEIIDYEEIDEDMARSGEYFGLQIKGDSMEPKISNNDVVIVRKQDDADDGDLVVAIVDRNEGCCKRLKKYNDGTIALLSTNPAYPPLLFTEAERDKKNVRIIGKVKELRAKF